MPHIRLTDLAFAWPDGTSVLDGVDLTLSAGRTGLIGANGTGKSTLLRLVAGLERPTRGVVEVSHRPEYLPQRPVVVGERVEHLLAVAPVRAAIRAVEGGSVAPGHFEVIGQDWDVDERAQGVLDRLGLGHLGLERPTVTLSGGEVTLLALAARLLRRPAVLLLDEPTNNLDRAARQRLLDTVLGFSGCLVVVSHDRELLGNVDQIAELRDGSIRRVGGDLTSFEAVVAAEQASAEQRVRSAQATVRRERADLQAQRTRQARHDRFGRNDAARSGMPKLAADARRRRAQESAGRLGDLHEERLADARGRLDEAERALRSDTPIAVDLPGTAVPSQRVTLSLHRLQLATGQVVDLELRGADRVALLGPNGVGKTTLLRAIVELGPDRAVSTPVPIRYLPQGADLLDDTLSVLDNLRAVAPTTPPGAVRSHLARLGLRGPRAEQLVGTLSGGERLRATLAALLLGEPPPQLLLLDEPTNNLDLSSAARLREALTAYRGSLIVVSHDSAFLAEIGLTRWLVLEPTGLREVTEAEATAP